MAESLRLSIYNIGGKLLCVTIQVSYLDGNFVDNGFDGIIESAAALSGSVAGVAGVQPPQNKKGKYDKFRLRLKFSHGLDPESISVDSAQVRSGNKKVSANVEYDKSRRSIIISPKSKYLRDTLYVLEVSGRIMSERGRSLRKNKVFVFAQDGESVRIYKNIDPVITRRAPEKLFVQADTLLPSLFAVSALVLVFSYFAGSKPGLIMGTVLVLLSTAAAFIDSVSDFGKSRREYIYGAKLYNRGYYFEAIECFELALHYSPSNTSAKKGLDAAIVKSSDADDDFLVG